MAGIASRSGPAATVVCSRVRRGTFCGRRAHGRWKRGTLVTASAMMRRSHRWRAGIAINTHEGAHVYDPSHQTTAAPRAVPRRAHRLRPGRSSLWQQLRAARTNSGVSMRNPLLPVAAVAPATSRKRCRTIARRLPKKTGRPTEPATRVMSPNQAGGERSRPQAIY